jgi:hypothetical protein
MRRFADFVRQQNYYRPNQIIGSVEETRYGNSCALGSYQGLLHCFKTGIHLATFPEKPKGKVSSKDKTYKLYRKFLKLRTGNYLGIEAIQIVEGKTPHAKPVYLTRSKSEGANVGSDAVLSVRFNHLAILANSIINGDYRNKKATVAERVALKKEIRALVKGKDVTCIVEISQEHNGVMYDKNLKLIQDAFGLFKKKPKLSFNFNNLVHPRTYDYLTFQLYRY